MLIGLNGRKQAGKDTVYRRALHLMDDVVGVTRVSFADKLYQSAAASLGVTVDVLQEWKTDPSARVRVTLPPPYGTVSDLTIREYLQRYGTEAHREVFADSFWVDAVDLEHGDRIVMVTDVRFENEARAVRAAGGIVVTVIGPPAVEFEHDAHPSEAGLPDDLIDEYLLNTVRDDGFSALDSQVGFMLRTRLRREEDLPEIDWHSRRVESA